VIIFLYGLDAYRIKQARIDIENRYKAKYSSGMNLYSFDLSIESGDRLDDVIRSTSFFNEHKLIVCKNIFSKKKSAEELLETLKKYNLSGEPSITLMVIENLSEKGLALKHKELFKALADKKNTIKVAEPLAGAELASWIKKEFESRDSTIQNSTIRTLIQMAGDDTWSLVNEIEKLASYKRGEVTEDDIRLMVSSKTDLNIFDLIDAIAQKNRARAVELLYKELKTGRDPYYILTMITYQFRNLLLIKGLQEKGLAQPEMANKAKLHPFVIKKSLACLSKFKAEELRLIYNRILNIDISSKNGIGQLNDYLYELVLA
jgi:DNA polymerase III subunit delta